MPIKIDAYYCTWHNKGCKKKIYKLERNALLHEKHCWFNPVNKSCRSCIKKIWNCGAPSGPSPCIEHVTKEGY
jgi:hypothetical protein